MLARSSNSSEWYNDDKWPSQVRKSGELSKTSTGKLVSNELVIDIDMDSDTAADWNLSLKSLSFLDRVNDRLRKMLDHLPEDAMQDIDKRSIFWGMCMPSTVEASVFMGKNYSQDLRSIKNTGNNLIMKQMFDTSEILKMEQSDEICGVPQISWESSPWIQLSLVNDEEVISLSHAKVYVFSDSVLCLGKMNQNPTSNTLWEDKLTWFKSSPEYRALDRFDGEPIGIRVEYLPRIHNIAARPRSPKVHEQNGEPEQFQGRIIFMSMFNDITWWKKTMKRNVLLIQHLCLH